MERMVVESGFTGYRPSRGQRKTFIERCVFGIATLDCQHSRPVDDRLEVCYD